MDPALVRFLPVADLGNILIDDREIEEVIDFGGTDAFCDAERARLDRLTKYSGASSGAAGA